jgi:hypothetical protein
LPQFLPQTTENITPYFTGMASIFMSMTFVVFVFYGAFAASARQYVINRPNAMKGVKGGQGAVCTQLWASRSQACVCGKVKRRSAPKQNPIFPITGLQH